MSKIDEILKKSLQGKIATDSKLGPEQERYPSSSLVDYASALSEAEVFGLPPMRDARFVGSTPHTYSNRAVLRPLSVPRRFRRWVEPALIFGADLFSEGGQLDITAPGTVESLQDFNFNGNFAQSPNFGVISDTFLMLHDPTNFTNDTAKSNLQALAVGSSTLDEITLATANLDVADGASQYRWSHYGFYPPQLLALPNSDGEVTAYAAIIPEDWPVFSWTREYSDLTFGFALTKDTINPVDVQSIASEQVGVEIPLGSLVVDDYVLLQSTVFHVDFVSNAGATDFALLTPLHPFDYDGLEFGAGQTMRTLYLVSELLADPTNSPGTDSFGNTIPALYDSPFLDWIRVRRLYPPAATNSNRSILGAFIDTTPSDKIGFAPAIIPATAGGARELAVNGITDFSNVTLDPAVMEDQEILVDYREGIFHFSHPIAIGSDLNPNSYTDSNGYPRLYATFAAYNRDTIPTTVTQLKRGGQKTGISGVPSSSQENSPVSGLQGWKVTLGDASTDLGDHYYYNPNESGDANPPLEYGGRNEALYLLESNTAHDDGPLMVFQKRSEVDGSYMVGALAYNGNGGADADDTSQFSFIPDILDNAGTGLTNTNRADFRVGTARQVVDVNNSLYYSITPGDLLEGSVNGIAFSIALIDDAADAADSAAPAVGINVTDGQRSIPEIIEDIVAKMPGTLVRGQDYDLSFYPDGTNYIFRFEASRSLEITTDDANFFGGATPVPEDIKLTFGYSGAVEAILRYVRETNELHFDGDAIRVQETALGVPGPAAWVYEGFDVTEQNLEGGTVFLGIEPGTIITENGPVRIREESRLALAPSQRVGVYFQASTGTVVTRNQLANEDTPFVSGSLTVNDVPLYVVATDAVPAASYVVDCRDFYQRANLTTNLTIGTEGRFEELGGALEYAKFVSAVSDLRPVIELLDSTTLVLDEVTTDSYPNIQPTPYNGAPIGLPENLLFLGNGFGVTVSGVPNETAGLGDPLFRANQAFNPGVAGLSNVEFRDVEFIVGAAQATAVSLMAGNFDNNGFAKFSNVTLTGRATEQFNLYGSTVATDSLQRFVEVKNCEVDGDLRIRSFDKLVVEDLVHTGAADPLGTIELICNVDAYLSLRGIKSESTASTGYFTQVSLQNSVNVHIQDFEANALTLLPETGTNVTDAFVTVSNVRLGTRLDLGTSGGADTLSGLILVDGVDIDTAATITAMTIRQVSQVEVRNWNITSSANVTVNVIDSDVDFDGFRLVNNSAATGATSKVGIRLQGDNGALINGVNAMDSDILIQNGVLVVDEGGGIYVEKANEAGKRTIIRNNRFENVNTASTVYRAVVFNADGGTASADNPDNVYISHNVFDVYAVSGTDNFAVGTTGVPATNLGDITIVFNHARGSAGGANAFANVGTSIVSNNAFTL